MNVPTPKFFVLDEQGNLHGYNNEVLLKCDLAAPPANRSVPAAKQIFRLNETGLTISYSTITATDLDVQNPVASETSNVILRVAA